MDARQLVLAPERIAPLAIRSLFRALCAVAPSVAAKMLERVWFKPPRPALSDGARAFLATGERIDLTVNGRRVAAWSWGEGPPVVLMHGWGGYGAQMQGFVEPLRRAGFRAVTFDAPSHGASGGSRLGSRRSTFFDFADALMTLADHLGGARGLIAHSGGCTSAAWAMRNGWSVPVAVFIAPMASPMLYQKMFQQALGITGDVMRRFAANVERTLEFEWKDLEMTSHPDVVSTPPTLVVHDREDRETSWREGAEIAAAWPQAKLLTTNGLGHRRPLRDAAVIEASVQFLALSPQAGRGWPKAG